MSLQEANEIVRMQLSYTHSGWYWLMHTMTPYGYISGYKKYPTPDEALEELKQFLRYFTKNVLKNGDTIRAYVNKHDPNKKEDD